MLTLLFLKTAKLCAWVQILMPAIKLEVNKLFKYKDTFHRSIINQNFHFIDNFNNFTGTHLEIRRTWILI